MRRQRADLRRGLKGGSLTRREARNGPRDPGGTPSRELRDKVLLPLVLLLGDFAVDEVPLSRAPDGQPSAFAVPQVARDGGELLDGQALWVEEGGRARRFQDRVHDRGWWGRVRSVVEGV